MQAVCKACMLLEGLNKGLPKLGISRARGPTTPAASGDVVGQIDGAGFVQSNGSIAGQTTDASDASCHSSSAVAQHPSARR